MDAARSRAARRRHAHPVVTHDEETAGLFRRPAVSSRKGLRRFVRPPYIGYGASRRTASCVGVPHTIRPGRGGVNEHATQRRRRGCPGGGGGARGVEAWEKVGDAGAKKVAGPAVAADFSVHAGETRGGDRRRRMAGKRAIARRSAGGSFAPRRRGYLLSH